MPYYRRNLYILSVTIFLAAVSWNQVMPFLPLFLKQLHAKGNLLGWISIVFAAQSTASIIAQPFWGKLGDYYGRKAMIVRAGVCLAGIYFGMSLCTAPWQVAACRFLNGALTGFIPGSVTLIATNTPEEYAPRSVASAQAASAAGLIVGPAIGAFLAELVGYRGSMQVSGAAVLFSTFIVWWFVKEPNKVKPAEKTSLLQDMITALRSPVQLAIMWALMIAAMFGAAISPYLTLYLKDMRAAEWIVGVVFSLPAVAFVISAQVWTRFGEQRGWERAILIGLVGGAVGSALLAAMPVVWLFGIVYFIAGLWLASISPSTAAITCTRVNEDFRGRAYGVQQSASTLGALIAPLAAGRIGAEFGIRSIFVFVAVVMLGGAFVFKMLIKRYMSLRKLNSGQDCEA